MTRYDITVIIPTCNEEVHMEELLSSVQWAAEILVVDSFSTDNTVAIARQYGAKVLQREYLNSANQKNWAIPQASHDWILLIDADERPTPELIQEVQHLAINPSQKDTVAYWINRNNFFMGQQVTYSGWQNDAVIRFFRKDQCRYEEKHVHAEILAKGNVDTLKGKLDHYTHRSTQHFLAKMERYAQWSAEDHYQKTPTVGFFHLAIKPLFRFFKHYILKRGFLDGRIGFIVSSIMAWGVFLRYIKIKEIQLEKKNKTK